MTTIVMSILLCTVVVGVNGLAPGPPPPATSTAKPSLLQNEGELPMNSAGTNMNQRQRSQHRGANKFRAAAQPPTGMHMGSSDVYTSSTSQERRGLKKMGGNYYNYSPPPPPVRCSGGEESPRDFPCPRKSRGSHCSMQMTRLLHHCSE